MNQSEIVFPYASGIKATHLANQVKTESSPLINEAYSNN